MTETHKCVRPPQINQILSFSFVCRVFFKKRKTEKMFKQNLISIYPECYYMISYDFNNTNFIMIRILRLNLFKNLYYIIKMVRLWIPLIIPSYNFFTILISSYYPTLTGQLIHHMNCFVVTYLKNGMRIP